jgi:hypothetical protein
LALSDRLVSKASEFTFMKIALREQGRDAIPPLVAYAAGYLSSESATDGNWLACAKTDTPA